MKKKKLIIFAAIIILCSFNLCLLYKNLLYRYMLYNESVVENDIPSNWLHEKMIICDSFLNNGLKIHGIDLYDTKDEKSIEIEDLLNKQIENKNILVCRFSEYDCEKCVDYVIEKCVEQLNKISSNLDLVIFGNYENTHALKVYCSNYSNLERVPIYNVSNIPLPIEEHGNPYLFVLDKSLTVLDVFTPNKMNPQLTDTYFEVLSNKKEQ